jgi:hypothetical protein
MARRSELMALVLYSFLAVAELISENQYVV